MKKNILQALSGGYDSTYLLIKNLQNGDNVYPIYIHSRFIYPLKQKIELTNVKNLINKLKKKYKNLHDLIETQITMSPIDHFFSTQSLTWILCLLREVMKNYYSVRYNEVHIGYIKNDCVIDYLPSLLNMWKLLFEFTKPFRFYSIPKLCFPLSKYNKKQIIKKIRSYDKNILSLCWTCEKPKIIRESRYNNSIELLVEACGLCTPCRKQIKTDKDLFDSLRKYKIIFNYKEFRNSIKSKLKKFIKNFNINNLRPEDFSMKYANNKRNKFK